MEDGRRVVTRRITTLSSLITWWRAESVINLRCVPSARTEGAMRIDVRNMMTRDDKNGQNLTDRRRTAITQRLKAVTLNFSEAWPQLPVPTQGAIRSRGLTVRTASVFRYRPMTTAPHHGDYKTSDPSRTIITSKLCVTFRYPKPSDSCLKVRTFGKRVHTLKLAISQLIV